MGLFDSIMGRGNKTDSVQPTIQTPNGLILPAKDISQAATVTPDERSKMLNAVIEQYNYRIRKDIGQWRMALAMAENPLYPRRLLLYNLYDDLCLDNFVSSLIQHQIKDKLFAQQFRVVDIASGEEDKELTAFFRQTWFYDFMGHAIDADFWGHSLIQMGDIVENPITGGKKVKDVQLIPRRHVVPERGLVTIYQSDSRGIPYRDLPELSYLIEVGGPKDLGVFNKAAAAIITKKNVMQAWSEFCEIFGMPLRVGYTPSNQKEDLERVANALRDMGSAAYAVLREGEKIDFAGMGSKADSAKIYEGILNFCNQELGLLVAGQLMTYLNGASKAQGNVHENTADDVMTAQKRNMRALVNDKLFIWALESGQPVKGKSFEYTEQTDLDALFAMLKELLPYIDLDDKTVKWIFDTFGIPVTAKKAVVPPPAPGKQPTEPDGDEEPKDDDLPEPLSKEEQELRLATVSKLMGAHMANLKLYGHKCEDH